MCVCVYFPCGTYFWYQSNSGFIQLPGSVPLTFIFILEEFVKIWCPLVLTFGRRHQWRHLVTHCFIGNESKVHGEGRHSRS